MMESLVLIPPRRDLLAVDPGGVSGIVRGMRMLPGFYKPLAWWELGQQETCDLIMEWCQLPERPAALVIERYWPQGGAKAFKPYSLEIIGVARWATKRAQIPMVMQNASDMKAHARAEAVRLHPLIGRGGEGHAKDALGHMHLFA